MKRIPEIIKKDDGYAFLVHDKPFIMLAGEVHNSACTSPEYMEHVWRKAKELNCNTVLAPVYWELIEADEHHFDFHLMEQLIASARQQGMKLVLLWFGSWKNGHSTYAPSWIKTNMARFPRTENEHGLKTRTLSLFQSDILSVELRSFTRFMKELHAYDADEQTVIAVQIENEVGILDATRDYSSGADAQYNANVPDALLAAIRTADATVLRKLVHDSAKQGDQSWGGVFQQYADETFMCWHYAQHINALARAGKAVYALPMFTNAWLKEGEDEKPGFYPSGGPLPDMLDVWKCGAPDLDALSPDIYSFQFDTMARRYARKDNPLLIPETRRDKWAVANLYTAIGAHHTLCYAPFGLESIGEDKSFITQIMHTDASDLNVSSETVAAYLSSSYEIFQNMMPIIAACYGTDRMIGFAQSSGQMNRHIRFGNWQMTIAFYHPIANDHAFIPGAGIIIQLSEAELIVVGYGFRADLETTHRHKQVDFLSLEKGTYDSQANWKRSMFLNGDEQHIRMEEKPTILRAVYYEYE